VRVLQILFGHKTMVTRGLIL